MGDSPKISVLIPTYNYAYCLDETIQSVLNQTYTDFELVVVDDCSKDNTDEVMEKYLQDKRVTYYKNEVNLGLVGNWNKCLSLAKGEYIKYLCADDKFRSDLLQKFVDVMEQYDNVSLITCEKQLFGGSNKLIKLPLHHLHEGKKIIYHTLSTYGWLGEPTTVMFRRSNMKLGGFRSDVTWLPDWEMWLRQLTAGDCYIIPEPLAYIRNHSNQVTKMVMRNYINYFEEYYLTKAIKEQNGYHFDISGIDMDQVLKMRAEKFTKVLLKIFPRIYKKRERKIFTEALKIAYKEKVLFSSLRKIFGKKNSQNGTVGYHESKAA